eukprot:TRINITY_DN49314_c0_g1_i1.p1 TRINITY_DN49314_c0_g1~~TRINITY_DN49314_c0_g1_i1.p1  ORF type:complete len:680 (+),score=75.13 TRINITY_DN49314_c0_g1_i1:169-2208(+)
MTSGEFRVVIANQSQQTVVVSLQSTDYDSLPAKSRLIWSDRRRPENLHVWHCVVLDRAQFFSWQAVRLPLPSTTVDTTMTVTINDIWHKLGKDGFWQHSVDMDPLGTPIVKEVIERDLDSFGMRGQQHPMAAFPVCVGAETSYLNWLRLSTRFDAMLERVALLGCRCPLQLQWEDPEVQTLREAKTSGARRDVYLALFQLLDRDGFQHRSSVDREPITIQLTWEYETKGHEWLKFPDEVSRQLEESYSGQQSGDKKRRRLRVGERLYSTDLQKMTLTDEETSETHRVRRSDMSDLSAACSSVVAMQASRDALARSKHLLETRHQEAMLEAAAKQADLQNELEDLRRQRDQLRVQNAQLQIDKGCAEDEACQFRRENMQLLKEKDGLFTAKDELTAHVRELSAKVDELTEQLRRSEFWQLQGIPRAPEGSRQQRHPIDSGEDQFKAVSRIFLSAVTKHRTSLGSRKWCDPPFLEIVRVEQVINNHLSDAYALARQRVAQAKPDGCTAIADIATPSLGRMVRAFPNLNEHLLFHGCSHSTADLIAKYGFDPQRGGQNAGKMFGVASYFADVVSKSDFYTACADCPTRGCLHRSAVRCIVAARVLLGSSFLARNPLPTQTKAPDDSDGRPHDSVSAATRASGGSTDHREYMIYRHDQALPLFLVFYRHCQECRCKDCQYRTR